MVFTALALCNIKFMSHSYQTLIVTIKSQELYFKPTHLEPAQTLPPQLLPQGLAAGRHHMRQKGDSPICQGRGSPSEQREGGTRERGSPEHHHHLTFSFQTNFAPGKMSTPPSLPRLSMSDEWNSSEAAIEKFSKKFTDFAASSTCGGSGDPSELGCQTNAQGMN